MSLVVSIPAFHGPRFDSWPGSIYPDWRFSWFSSVHPDKFWYRTLK